MPEKVNFLDEIILLAQKRYSRLYKYMAKGVKILDPLTIFIDEGVKIGKGTVIHPMTLIEPGVSIGKDCSIGPFARLRKGVKIKDGVIVGNFVEIVRSTISSGCRVKHLTYVGDTFIEEKVNIGAGTIVANYDGKEKNKTRIKKGAFIGSGSILVAPVVIGKSAMTGAGAVVTKNHNVPDDSVVVGIPARVLRRSV